MPFSIRGSRTEFRSPLLGTVAHFHVRDGSAGGIKHNTLNLLRGLWILNDDNFPHCLRRGN